MADPNCTYAVVDMSKKKKNRELTKRESSDTDATYYNMGQYSMISYDTESQELSATIATATDEDYSKLQNFSRPKSLPNAEPVVTKASAKPCLKESLSCKKQAIRPACCAVAIALSFVGLIASACIGVLFVEIGRLKSQVSEMQTSSESSSQISGQLLILQERLDTNISEVERFLNDQLAHLNQNFSVLSEAATEQQNLTEDLNKNVTRISNNQDQHRQTFEESVMALNTKLLATNSSFQDNLTEVQNGILNNSINMALGFQRLENLISRARAEFNQNFIEVQTELENDHFEVQRLRDYISEMLPASCAALPSSSPSGYHWVRASNGSAVRVYCDITRSCGGVTGGWMRVAELDMTNSSHRCPRGFTQRTDINIRTCVRNEPSAGCFSTLFSTVNIDYRKVCGKIIAYQIGGTNAFATGLNNISSYYVDGISLTRGNPREHIWTFAAARDETVTSESRDSKCPCITNGQSRPPSFVGNDYFCDTGSTVSSITNDRFFRDPLWDGDGCGASNRCCRFNTPPWFYKELPEPASVDVEMRVCRNEIAEYEDIAIQEIELYIQ